MTAVLFKFLLSTTSMKRPQRWDAVTRQWYRVRADTAWLTTQVKDAGMVTEDE